MRSTLVTRTAGATALGAAVTALVLLLMQSLIESDATAVDEQPPGATLTFLPLLEDEPPERQPDEPQPPPKPDVPPPVPRQSDYEASAIGGGWLFTPPAPEPPAGPTTGVLSDGDALPVVKVRPVYPANAVRRGIEGQVLVRFTIDELGRVVGAVVVDARPRGVFERAALEAVERFRYKPRVVNGQPTPVSDVQHLLTFELDG